MATRKTADPSQAENVPEDGSPAQTPEQRQADTLDQVATLSDASQVAEPEEQPDPVEVPNPWGDSKLSVHPDLAHKFGVGDPPEEESS